MATHSDARLGFRALLLAICVSVLSAQVAAQERLPPIPPDKLTDAQKAAVAEFKAHRGADISGPFIPLLRNPEVMNRTRAMGDYLRYKTALGPALNELVILLTARYMSQSYEWSTHQPIAIKSGVSADIALAISEGRRPEEMSADQELTYDLCTELLHNHSVSDKTYSKALARFGDMGVIDMIGVVGYYTYLGMVLNVARTPLDAPGLPTRAPLVREQA